MSAPRHLWSGEWRRESAAVAEELAQRRGQSEPPAEPATEPQPAYSRPSAAERAAAWLRSWTASFDRPRLRKALLVGPRPDERRGRIRDRLVTGRIRWLELRRGLELRGRLEQARLARRRHAE